MLTKAFKTLRLSRKAELDEIRRSYVKLVQRYPPEHFPEKFCLIKAAYDQLALTKESVEAVLTELAHAKTIPDLKFRLFGDMVEETETGPDLEVLLNMSDNTRITAAIELITQLKGGSNKTPIEYRQRPAPRPA